jgi:phosphoglycolate phosphatase
MTKHPEAVVFDLDGTLVDSAADIALALNRAFAPLGFEHFGCDDVKTMIGGGSSVLVDRAAVKAGFTLDRPARADVQARFMSDYRQVSAEGRGLYPGAQELLYYLRGNNIRSAICTNKPALVTDIAVRALGLHGLVDYVIGARDEVAKKPDAAMLLACCTALKSAPTRTVMVGDSAADHGCARAAGCPIILVDFGYSKGPVAELQPDAVVSHLDDIPAVLLRLSYG